MAFLHIHRKHVSDLFIVIWYASRLLIPKLRRRSICDKFLRFDIIISTLVSFFWHYSKYEYWPQISFCCGMSCHWANFNGIPSVYSITYQAKRWTLERVTFNPASARHRQLAQLLELGPWPLSSTATLHLENGPKRFLYLNCPWHSTIDTRFDSGRMPSWYRDYGCSVCTLELRKAGYHNTSIVHHTALFGIITLPPLCLSS